MLTDHSEFPRVPSFIQRRRQKRQERNQCNGKVWLRTQPPSHD